MNKQEHFTKFPKVYIQENIKDKYGISRKFYIIYILIDKYRSYEDYSWITIRKILDFYGYKTTKNKPKALYEILDVLEYMINNKMIEVKQDLDSLSYDTGIEIKIISENFDHPDKFVKITSSQLETIMMADTSLNKENILMAFLYICSYMFCRQSKDNDNKNKKNNDNPEAFFRSINHMSNDLGMSKTTINQCIDFLTSPSPTHNALLVKGEMYNFCNDIELQQNTPSVYVLNKYGYEKEIEWAIEKMKQLYSK